MVISLSLSLSFRYCMPGLLLLLLWSAVIVLCLLELHQLHSPSPPSSSSSGSSSSSDSLSGSLSSSSSSSGSSSSISSGSDSLSGIRDGVVNATAPSWSSPHHYHHLRSHQLHTPLSTHHTAEKSRSVWEESLIPTAALDVSDVWESPKGVLLASPLHTVTYGSPLSGQLRTPLVMIKMKLMANLHKRFLSEHMFSCNQSDLDLITSLDRRVKLPVYIYEGYFHSMPSTSAIYSKNPNPLIGVDFMKPAAEEFLRAFYTAFRHTNRQIFFLLQEALFASARSRSQNPEHDVCHVLASWIQQDRIFGDLSIQIHYGEGNDKNFPRGWHVDAENSLLHLAVTLRGARVLHSKRCAQNHGAAVEELDPQVPGDVYLTSSALMLHAPKFSYADYDDRVIAIHARILYTSDELRSFRKYRTEESWTRLTAVLADHLSAADFRLPSLSQVQRTMESFSM